MGAWGTSINGNDTAQDLKYEYQTAFYHFDVETAVMKIDAYVRGLGIDESDEAEWCDYFYSLADFMWKKSILTEDIKQKCVSMIEGGFGLDAWAESGEKILDKRKKTLAEFKEKISSPQCPPKKINVNLYLNSVFDVGDVVAFKLKTADKAYLTKDSAFTEEFFKSCDGKYIVIKKVEDHISYSSRIVPEIADHWIIFKLYKKIFDVCPSMSDLKNVGWASTTQRSNCPTQTFSCESKLFYFKKRDFKIICSEAEKPEEYANYFNGQELIFFSINVPHCNADTYLINAILK